ncbi:hypothetical protein QN277_019668 [Acacia crassicarpa]|uniref:Retrovirus-related Pol polyprotein from transposon TNT 1-94-like beta-barrel domain-containing protein n=1 Tax=Acacia crassicarpa TaxID=499986 RepID=A0AAE1JJU2_9FABA|nr:hypothetical protein QN277_019668 [Acacia crassicarpa]
MFLKAISPRPEASNLISKQIPSSDSGSNKSCPMCDQCKKIGHTKDKCWKLHGKPSDWIPRKPSRSPSAHQTTIEADTPLEFVPPSLNTEQKSQLLNLLKNLKSSQGPVATIAKQGNDHFTLISSSSLRKWIVDTGASDHMTLESRIFTSYSPLAGNNQIRTTNNSSASIVGTGTVPLTRDSKLDSIFHVPHLAYNLLSISKLTKHTNCSAHFFATHCIFQDLSSRKTIGIVKEHDGLYYLDDSSASSLSS